MLNETTNQTAPQQAVLAAVDTGEWNVSESMDELESLAEAAGAQSVARVVQKRAAFDAATVIGEGRLREIADFCATGAADTVIFDHELSPSQMRNISNVCGVNVIDRTTLILDIFAQRAVTAEGKLQVELAQLQYRLPRLTGLGTALSRLGGGIGTRGPGETQLETDRRHIRRRIDTLKEQLAALEKRRGLLRSRRHKDGVCSIAIVGYTNVGKSTLLNTLTSAGVLTQDALFATLDPTSRALTLPDGRSVMLIDTVGLVRRLPHNLVRAFHSTLEEAAFADLLWCVCDGTADAQAQLEVTRRTLEELGVTNTPSIAVVNKCDMLRETPVSIGKQTALISAKTGLGLDALLQKTAELLTPAHRRMKLLIPYDQAGFVNTIMQEGKVFEQDYRDNGIFVDALVQIRLIDQASAFAADQP